MLEALCRSSGTTLDSVHAEDGPPITQRTSGLGVFGTVRDQPMISVGARDPDGTKIHEFHGSSAIGLIADNAGVSLVRMPGGKLGTSLSSVTVPRTECIEFEDAPQGQPESPALAMIARSFAPRRAAVPTRCMITRARGVG
jgi:hypothetical protein